MTERIVGCLADACVMQTREIIRLDKEAEYQASKIEAKDKRIAELEAALESVNECFNGKDQNKCT